MKNIYILTLILFIISCGDKVREEITERYDNGQKKLLVIYKGEGSKEVVVERITYGSRGDTLFWEKPLEDFYYEKVREEITESYDDGKKKTIMKFKGSGSEKVITNKQIKGGLLISLFGGGSLNLLNTDLNKDKNVLRMISIFGGHEILVPTDMNVEIQVLSIFGGFDDSREVIDKNQIQSDKRLIIRGLELFGGGSVYHQK